VVRKTRSDRVIFALICLAAVTGCSLVSGPSEVTDVRREVASLVERGELGDPSLEFELVRLPSNYSGASETGEIVVTRETGTLVIVFFTRRGLLDSYEGVAYVPSGRSLAVDPLGGNPVELSNLGGGWYRIVAN
jgi:hypothetical protein